MHEPKMSSLFLSSLLLLSALVIPVPAAKGDLSDASALTDHDPIRIYSDSDFTAANGVVAGAGTKLSPYIIENWTVSINASSGIVIVSTGAHFIVRNCLVVGTSGSPSYDGIYLALTKNGLVANNRVLYSSYGIYVDESTKIMVRDNLIMGSTNGIEEYYSDNVTFRDNTLVDNDHGIRLTAGVDLTLTDNDIEGNMKGPGLDLFDVMDLILKGNSMSNNTFDLQLYLTDLESEHLVMPQNNTVGGRAVIFWKDLSNKQVPADAGFIKLVRCHGITVSNQNISKVYPAIEISDGSDHITISNSTFMDLGLGVLITNSNNIIVQDSNFTNASQSILTWYGLSHLTVRNNVFTRSYTTVWVNTGTDVVFDNNTLTDCFDYCLHLQDLSKVQVSHNNISGQLWEGIWVQSSQEVQITDNYIANGFYYGIHAEMGSNNLSILRNRMYKNSIDGVYIVGGNGVKVQNNSMWGNTQGAFIEGGGGSVDVGSNVVDHNDLTGIIGIGQGTVIHDNLVYKNGGPGIGVLGGSVDILDNVVHDNKGGMSFSYATGGLVSGNDIQYNATEPAFNCTSSTGMFIYNNIILDGANADTNTCGSSWSIPKKAGRNLVNGSYLGGNFWSNYTGRDTDGDLLGNTKVPYGPGDSNPMVPAPPFMEDRTTGQPSIGQKFLIQAAIMDRFGLSSYKVDFWFDNGTHNPLWLFFNSSDGVLGIYERVIDVPIGARNLSYILEATNPWDQTNKTAVRVMSIIDTIAPKVKDLTGFPSTGENLTFAAVASDNIEIASVVFRYNIDTGPYSNVSGAFNGSAYVRNITIPQRSLSLNYSVIATDLYGLNATLPIKRLGIRDSILPTITDTSLTPRNGEAFNITYQTADNFGVVSTEVLYWFDNLQASTVHGNNGSALVLVPNNVAKLYYRITTVDTSDNTGELNGTRDIVDGVLPTFELVPIDPSTGQKLHVKVSPKDNRAVASVDIKYSLDNITWNNKSLSAGTPAWDTDIDIPANAIFLAYKIVVLDSSNNSATGTGWSAVRDVIPPALGPLGQLKPQTGADLVFRPNATDNIGIDHFEVLVWFNSKADGTRAYFSTYWTITVPSNATVLNYELRVRDTSGNNADTSGRVQIVDSISPTISDRTTGTPQAGKTFTIKATAADNVDIRYLTLFYVIDGKEYSENMTLVQDLYSYSIELPSGAKSLKYSVVATDVGGNKVVLQERTVKIQGGSAGGSMTMVLVIVGIVAVVAVVAAVFMVARRKKPAPVPLAGPGPEGKQT